MSLRARLTLAAVAALALVGLLVLVALSAAVARDGRDAVDDGLTAQAEQVLRRPGPGGPGGPGFGPGFGRAPDRPDRLLAGTGTFVQVAIDGQVVQQSGDVPAGAPAPPASDGLQTVQIAGVDWRSFTQTFGRGRLQVLRTLAPVQARVDRIQRLVLLLGLAALALLGLTVWGFTTVALRPLDRLRAGAAGIGGAEDLRVPLPDDDGPTEVRQLAGALNDMLARLDASTVALRRALEATRRFAADAGHELRTPLAGLRANLDVLDRNPELATAERVELVGEMAAEQERMVHLLEGLTALARGEAAETLPREDVELGDLVDAAIHGARKRHPQTTFEVDDQAEDAVVHGWPGGLRLVLDNLLNNAALHGGGRVALRLRHIDGGEDVGSEGAARVRLEVADDGPGIPVGERAAVLEPFARGAAPQAPGTGLGLAIVAQQVALHQGRLELGDALGGGLLVTVELPAGATG